jgi:predicted homoserine dehydrogenase-like protein
MKHIEALIDDGGNISIGALDPIDCAATAADHHNTLVMLVRRDGETLGALLKRLGKALGSYYETGETIDELNAPSG